MAEVIVALDHPRGRDALALVDALPGMRWAKVGSTLFSAEGPDIVRALVGRNIAVFLDLKWHDIPHQVAGSVRAARALGVRMVTVHALGGRRMLEAAVEAAGPDLRVAAVSVLTSHDQAEWSDIVGQPADTAREVGRLAALVRAAGGSAMVAAPSEAAAVRAALAPGAWIVTPGIRPGGAPADDQRRVATAREAVAAGATHLVVGRPITGSDRPGTVYEELCREAAG